VHPNPDYENKLSNDAVQILLEQEQENATLQLVAQLSAATSNTSTSSSSTSSSSTVSTTASISIVAPMETVVPVFNPLSGSGKCPFHSCDYNYRSLPTLVVHFAKNIAVSVLLLLLNFNMISDSVKTACCTSLLRASEATDHDTVQRSPTSTRKTKITSNGSRRKDLRQNLVKINEKKKLKTGHVVPQLVTFKSR